MRVFYASFDPPLERGVRFYSLNGPSDKNFFWYVYTFMCFRRNFKIWTGWPRFCGFVGMGRVPERVFLAIWRNSMSKEPKKCEKMYFRELQTIEYDRSNVPESKNMGFSRLLTSWGPVNHHSKQLSVVIKFWPLKKPLAPKRLFWIFSKKMNFPKLVLECG